MDLLILCLFALTAGFIDAIAGGGGLIQLPAVFMMFPNLTVAQTMGTNKFAAFSGTSVATIRYLKNGKLPWQEIFPGIITALLFSFLGARAISLFSKEMVKPIILVLLVLVTIYTIFKKDLGKIHAPRVRSKELSWLYAGLTGAVLGFYDGFFGPGTGSFLIMIFVSIFGYGFMEASASAKLFNCATNVAALIFFMLTGNVVYQIALPLALCNMTGNYIGAHLAIRKGSGFIRIFFLLMVGGLILKLGKEMFLN